MNVDPADLEAVAAQLGRTPRGVLEISTGARTARPAW